MPSWHQQQAMRRAYRAGKPIQLWHETLWTVVHDDGGFTSLTRCATKKQAETCVKNCGGYILSPQKGTMIDSLKGLDNET